MKITTRKGYNYQISRLSYPDLIQFHNFRKSKVKPDKLEQTNDRYKDLVEFLALKKQFNNKKYTPVVVDTLFNL